MKCLAFGCAVLVVFSHSCGQLLRSYLQKSWSDAQSCSDILPRQMFAVRW